MSATNNSNLHVVMFPWFAIGHITPFLQLATQLAHRGCKVTVLLPKKVHQQLQQSNGHSDSITLHPLTIPPVDGLPPGAETASDIPFELTGLLCTAHDQTRSQFEKIIQETRPALVVYDFAHWIPEVTKPLGIRNIYYQVVCCAAIPTSSALDNVKNDKALTDHELVTPPVGYPSSKVVYRPHEARALRALLNPGGENITVYERLKTAGERSDVMAFRTCSEIDGEIYEYVRRMINKPVLLTGPVLPEPPSTPLEERWASWLSGFEPGSVVFCAFGSQSTLEKEQFQELCLGFELTGSPFFIALKPPIGAATMEEALPEGFGERVKGRGVVWGGWVQQVQILNHPSIGCFVNHCGFGSMWESLLSDCQIVLVPQLGDQILNTRLLAGELKVAIEVEKEENGWFSKENLSKAIKAVMDNDSEVASTLKNNCHVATHINNTRFH